VPWQAPTNNYKMMELKNDLNRLLPRKFYPVVGQLVYEVK
jgi:hypothetical protein